MAFAESEQEAALPVPPQLLVHTSLLVSLSNLLSFLDQPLGLCTLVSDYCLMLRQPFGILKLKPMMEI